MSIAFLGRNSHETKQNDHGIKHWIKTVKAIAQAVPMSEKELKFVRTVPHLLRRADFGRLRHRWRHDRVARLFARWSSDAKD
jgi:hypothetical protein